MRTRYSLLAVVFVLVFQGCAPEGNPASLQILTNALVGLENACQMQAGAKVKITRPVGVMDLLMTNRYIMFPSIFNAMESSLTVSGQTAETGGLEMNSIVLSGARISYDIEGLLGGYDGSDTDLPSSVFSPTSGTLEPGDYSTVTLDVIPPYIGNILDKDLAFDTLNSAGTMIVHVSIEGRMLDGTKLQSNEFLFPITICRGCLLYYNVLPTQCCRGIFEAPDACVPGQDSGVPCDVACILTMGMDREDKKIAMIMREIDSLADEVSFSAGEDVISEDVLQDDVAESEL